MFNIKIRSLNLGKNNFTKLSLEGETGGGSKKFSAVCVFILISGDIAATVIYAFYVYIIRYHQTI